MQPGLLLHFLLLQRGPFRLRHKEFPSRSPEELSISVPYDIASSYNQVNVFLLHIVNLLYGFRRWFIEELASEGLLHLSLRVRVSIRELKEWSAVS